MAINCFLKKILGKLRKCTLCSLKVMKIYPDIDQYSHKVTVEEAICFDINKVLIKIEKNLNEKRK